MAGAVDTVVVGGGQAGLSASYHLSRHGREHVVLEQGRLAEAWRTRRWDGVSAEHAQRVPGRIGSQVLPSARLAGDPTASSDEIEHLCGPRRLARQGVVLVGRLAAVDGSRARFRSDLEEQLAESDEFAARFRQRVDDHVRAAALDVPEEASPRDEPVDVDALGELDLRAAGVETIVWANGYRPDFGWIEPPIVDADGWPIQTRGVTSVPGLYFVGLNWLSKRKSALLLGVGEDAEHVVSALVGDSRSGRLAHA